MGSNRQRNKPKGTYRRATTLKGGKGEFRLGHPGLNDRVSMLLRRATARYGNDDASKALKKLNTRRDALLAFILTRLIAVRNSQVKEQHELNDRESWFRRVFRGAMTLPDPTRWAESARRYELAAEAICRGHIGRGVRLIEAAIEAEYAAFESAPEMVEDDLDETEAPAEAPPMDRPPEMDKIGNQETCDPIPMDPLIQQVADQILSVQSRAPLVGWRAKQPHRWWAEEEEEEEEDDGA
ncbi:MAG: hypothetical protein H6739_29785 [Alphaproteobacteria bacterium]|nr:hypothetical protein [Alphaproteobacteria bacterium]